MTDIDEFVEHCDDPARYLGIAVKALQDIEVNGNRGFYCRLVAQRTLNELGFWGDDDD
jgi:hypothetical protein